MSFCPFEEDKAVVIALRKISKYLEKDKEQILESFINELAEKKPNYCREPGEDSMQDSPQWIKDVGLVLHEVYRAGAESGMKLSSFMPPNYATDPQQFIQFMQESQNDPILKEFGHSSSSSEIYATREKEGEKLPNDPNAGIELGRGESVEIKMKMTYVKRPMVMGRMGEGPNKVLVRPISERSLAKRKAGQLLDKKEAIRMMAQYTAFRKKGTCDPDLFYAVDKLLSFPDWIDFVELQDMEIKRFKIKISIPIELPDELLAQPFVLIASAEVNPDYVAPFREIFNIVVNS